MANVLRYVSNSKKGLAREQNQDRVFIFENSNVLFIYTV